MLTQLSTGDKPPTYIEVIARSIVKFEAYMAIGLTEQSNDEANRLLHLLRVSAPPKLGKMYVSLAMRETDIAAPLGSFNYAIHGAYATHFTLNVVTTLGWDFTLVIFRGFTEHIKWATRNYIRASLVGLGISQERMQDLAEAGLEYYLTRQAWEHYNAE